MPRREPKNLGLSGAASRLGKNSQLLPATCPTAEQLGQGPSSPSEMLLSAGPQLLPPHSQHPSQGLKGKLRHKG